MAKYQVTYYYHTQIVVDVEANSKEEAIENGRTEEYDMGQVFNNLQEDSDPDAVEV